MIERAVALAPDDGAIVDSLGWAYYHLHEYRRAVHELERAVTLSPEDPTINDHLGDAYWRVGRHAEARYQWQRVLTLKPKPKQIPILKRKIAVGLGESAGLDKRRVARVIQAGS
jgi:Flp pilus assembly protein TadD